MGSIVQRLVGFDRIARILRDLRARMEEDELAVLVVYPDDPVAWWTFDVCTDCGVLGLPVGQLRDCRYSLADGSGMHAHVFDDRIELHVDECDACRSAAGHAVADTEVVRGTAWGVFGGGLLAILTRNPKMLLLGGAVGAVGGVMTPKRPKRRRFELRALLAAPPPPPQLAPWV